MQRFILTGAPGAGKTAILRQLERDGFGVVEEAATDLIALEQALGEAEPWRRPSFVDAVADLQRRRQIRAASWPDAVQFHDRSAICTRALATFLGLPVSDALRRELERIEADAIYQKRVFFIATLGFITRTPARQISLDDALRFERMHEEAYRTLGYEIVRIAPGPLADRVRAVEDAALRG
jgi:predicted ATPase